MPLYEAVGDADRAGAMRVTGAPCFQVLGDADGRFIVIAEVRVACVESIAVASTAPLVGSVTVAPGS